MIQIQGYPISLVPVLKIHFILLNKKKDVYVYVCGSGSKEPECCGSNESGSTCHLLNPKTFTNNGLKQVNTFSKIALIYNVTSR